jgi:hypothetical protein
MEGLMSNRFPRLIVPVVLLLGSVAAPLSAQTPVQSNVAGRGTELGGSVGAANASTETAPVVTGTAGWRLTHRVALEARGSWFARGVDATGIGADVGALVNLVPRRRATPYVGAAFGLYRAQLDVAGDHVPTFYRLRHDDHAMADSTVRTFTDPAWRFSAGVEIVHHRTLSIRPELGVILVHRSGATDTITTLGVRLGYVFEDHPVTPARR